MPEIDNLLKALEESEKEEKYESDNDDLDLDDVFAFFDEECKPHEMRFPDGATGYLTF